MLAGGLESLPLCDDDLRVKAGPEYTLGHGGKDAIIGNRGDVLRREGPGFDQHLIERVSAAVAPARRFNDFFEAPYFGGFPPSSLVTLQRRFL